MDKLHGSGPEWDKLLRRGGRSLVSIMELRPHHVLDIISDWGNGAEFGPHPYGHDVHGVAEALLSDTLMKVRWIIGADAICAPCIHLREDGSCDDVLEQVAGRPSKQAYNDALDAKVFEILGLETGTVTTFAEYLELVNAQVPGIEEVCTHPGEDTASRLKGLIAGLVRLHVQDERGESGWEAVR